MLKYVSYETKITHAEKGQSIDKFACAQANRASRRKLESRTGALLSCSAGDMAEV